MKLQTLAVLATLFTTPILAQSLPDEINYQPHLERLRTLEGQIGQQESQIRTINEDIAESRRFIAEAQVYIVSMQNEIRSNDSQIADHRSTIPNLQRQIQERRNQIASLERDRQSLEAQFNQLRNQDQQLRAQIRPLEESLNRRISQIRVMENELVQFQRDEQNAAQKIQLLTDRVRTADAEIQRERGEQEQMRRDLAQLESRIGQLQQNLSQNENQLAQDQNNLRMEEGKLASLNDRVREAQAELDAIRRQGPSAEAVAAAERKLASETQRRDAAQASVSNIRSQISSLTSQIANLQNSISTNQTNLNTEEGKLSGLTERVKEYQAELDALRAQGAAADVITLAERKLKASTAKRDETATTVSNLRTEIARAQSQIPSLQSNLSNQQNSLGAEENRLQAANAQVRQAQAELDAIRNQGPNPAQVAAAEAKLRNATANRDATANAISGLRNSITRNQAQVNNLREQIATERRNQSSLPARLSQSEARERDLGVRRQAANNELAQANGEVIAAQRRSQTRVEQIRQAQAEMRNDEIQAERLRQNIAGINQQMDQNRANENNVRGQSAQLANQIDQLGEDERARAAAIPQLEAATRQARADITESEGDIRKAQADEAKLLQSLSQTQTRLAQTRSDASGVQTQYQSRYSLFNKYLAEARTVGTSQVTTADDLGTKAGAQLAKTKSTSVGQSIGKDLGSSQGKYWALVRSEVIGYPKGYEAGRRSQEDITRAASQATKKATDAAEAHAQTNLKPEFFNQHYLTELQRPVEKGENEDSVVMKMAMKRVLVEKMIAAGVDPVTAEEVAVSNRIITSLDASVAASVKEVKQLVEKQASLAKPEVVYETPATVPFGQVQCTQVYKNLQVYKDACLAAYREDFSQIFQSATEEKFSLDYPALYQAESKKVQLNSQSTQFDLSYPQFSKVTENEGLVKGKEDIFNETFSSTYQTVYAAELPVATERANTQAQIEVKDWVSTNAAMTVQGHELSKKVIRGGDEVKLIVDLKNVSPADSKSVMLFKVSKPSNAEMPRLEFSQTGAKGNSITKFEEITFKVPASAKSGEKITFQVDALLPGHKFVNQRTEILKIEKTLAANPKLEVDANYDQSPNIRIIRFKTHTLGFTIKPIVEDIADGYEVELQIVEGEQYINLAGSTKPSGALKKDESKKFSYSYSFKKTAKGKKVKLKAIVRYLGEVVNETDINMVPR